VNLFRTSPRPSPKEREKVRGEIKECQSLGENSILLNLESYKKLMFQLNLALRCAPSPQGEGWGEVRSSD